MFAQQLQKRDLPDLMILRNGEAVTADNWPKRKCELIDSLSKNLFGYTPAAPQEIRVKKTDNYRYHAFAGKVGIWAYAASWVMAYFKKHL